MCNRVMYVKIGILVCVFLPQLLAEKCLTPNNETAECIPLYSCPILIGALASQHETSIKFVTESNCGGTAKYPMACCGTLSNFTTVKLSTRYQNKNESKIQLLPTNQYCGYQHADDYIRTKNDTSIRITEFPWSARIKFRNPMTNASKYLCSASLINRRYVLTVTHCVHKHNRYIAEAIQLGEYHVKNKTDCVQEQQFDEECSEPVEEIVVEKVITHPKYDQRKQLHDIALIRLAKNVNYSDYIRPICLPLPGRTIAKVGDTLLSTGWGKIKWRGDTVDIKKKIVTQLVSLEVCKEKYSEEKYEITEDHLCSLEFHNNTDFECQGDSGGPLMFSYNNQWQQEGIVAYGKGCGGVAAAVYTNVKRHLEWILDTIEP